MRSRFTRIKGNPSGFWFYGRQGRYSLEIFVPAGEIAKLADILEQTGGHPGHAGWHYNNPHAAIPCSTCTVPQPMKEETHES